MTQMGVAGIDRWRDAASPSARSTHEKPDAVSPIYIRSNLPHCPVKTSRRSTDSRSLPGRERFTERTREFMRSQLISSGRACSGIFGRAGEAGALYVLRITHHDILTVTSYRKEVLIRSRQ